MEISLDERWAIGGKPHGGYLLREAVVPALDDLHPHPMAVSAHFLRSPDPGPATVQVETLRNGRRVSQHRTRIVQHDQTVLEALVTSGTLDPDAEPFWNASAPPAMPPVEDCPRAPAEPFPGFRIGHLEFVESRPDPDTVAFASGRETTPGRVAAHLRMTDPFALPDLLVLADALPPVTFDLGVAGWVPTVELTVLLRGVPAAGWFVGEQRARLMQDGWIDEECDIWDSRGRLVCQARQLAGYRLSS